MIDPTDRTSGPRRNKESLIFLSIPPDQKILVKDVASNNKEKKTHNPPPIAKVPIPKVK
jgi:hypothetical protein